MVHAVAVTRGITPKEELANRGAQRVPKRNSVTGTSRKNSRAGNSRARRMPIVTAPVVMIRGSPVWAATSALTPESSPNEAGR